MALADISPGGPARRLDSWKEIAEYLGRDVRTVTRWESQGLPLHRVPGGKGSSVFAFTSEIDAWLAGHSREVAPLPVSEPILPQAAPVRVGSRGRRIIVMGIACAIGATLAGVAIVSRTRNGSPEASTLRVSATETQVSIADGSGASRVIHRFDPGVAVLIAETPAHVADLDGEGEADILVGVSFYDNRADRSIRSGELLNLSPAGAVRWRFSFDDVVRFRDGTVSGPWAMSDWQAGPAASSPAKVAVAAHDYIWWASMVAVLDHDGRRLGSFTNPGWIESVQWLNKDRLAIAGFNNARNEAMLALLDANAAGGQAPGTAGTPFACVSCASTPPLFYATFPRSELNLLTGGRFNRADVAILADQIVVSTTEILDPPATATATAIAMYEFDGEFRFLRARYSESYWDAHRRLEIEGRLTHTRETCPERDGPPAIHVWSGSDWTRTVVTR